MEGAKLDAMVGVFDGAVDGLFDGAMEGLFVGTEDATTAAFWERRFEYPDGK
jgi:hypothetical protein